MRHLAERHAKLVVEPDEAFDTSRDARIRDPAVDVAREIDDLIGLSQHLVHDGLPSTPTRTLRCASDTTETPHVTTETGSFGTFAAQLISEEVGGDTIAHWQVADLERHVDRRALLAGEDPPESPYW